MLFLLGASRDGLTEQKVRAGGLRLLAGQRKDFQFNEMDGFVDGVLQDVQADITCLDGGDDRMGDALFRRNRLVGGHIDNFLPVLVVVGDFDVVGVVAGAIPIEGRLDEIDGFGLFEIDGDPAGPLVAEP